MTKIASTDLQIAVAGLAGEGPRIRLIGAVLGGTLPALVYAILPRIGLGGEFASRGNTLEGFPYDALMIAIGTVVGFLLGCLAAQRIVAATGPVRWIVGLALLAPPLGGLVFMTLTGIQELRFDGDFSRWSSWFLLVLTYSFVVALPTTSVVSFGGTLLLRRLVLARGPVVIATCVLLLASAIVIGGGSLVATLGTLGVGPGVPHPVPTLAEAPPVARETAITVAAPHATELSLTPAVLVSADAYRISDLCDQDGVFPSIECEYPGLGWAVVFAITAPDGQPITVLVMIDAVTGELLYTTSQ